jgi:hypothetical protein
VRLRSIHARLTDRDVQVGLALGLLALALYLLTMCPTVYWYDSAEFAAQATALGVPHPPGYPLYTMIAHVFTWLPVEPAWSVNFMSVTFGVGCVELVFVLGLRLGLHRVSSAVGALTLGTGVTFWGNAVVAEVYTPGLFFTLGAFLLLERGLARHRPRLLIAAAFVGGLGLGMHMSIATCGVGYAWLVLNHGIGGGIRGGIRPQRVPDLAALVRDAWSSRLPVLASCVVATFGGALAFLYIPWRKFERWDDPIEWIGFRKNATGGAFKRKFLIDYDWNERFQMTADIAFDNLHVVGFALAVVGCTMLVRRRPVLAIGLLLGALGNVYWFFNYAVPDLDVFYLPALAIASLGVGAGVEQLGALAQRLRPGLSRGRVLGLVFPAYLLAHNFDQVDLSGKTEAAVYGQAACRSTPPGAAIMMDSRPPEWRLYSVYLYVQQALGECEDIEILKRPKIGEVRRRLARRQPVFAFLPPPRMEGKFAIEETGVLYRLTSLDQPMVRRQP